MNKIIHPGDIVTEGNERRSYHPIFCKIGIESGKLSISGVIHPYPSGNAWGGCGQIDMGFAHRDEADNDKRYRKPTTPDEIRFAPGWNADLWFDFLDIWQRWHLNDMRAGCEHQRQLPEFQARDIVLTTAELDWSAKNRLEKQAEEDIYAQYGENVTFYQDNRVACPVWPETETSPARPAGVSLATGYKFSPAIAALKVFHDLNLRSFSKTYITPDDLKKHARRYARYHLGSKALVDLVKWGTETKNTGWLRQSEHPDGILNRPCPVCGYKHGSAWLREDLPQTVIDFLIALPNSDKKPAWI